MKKVRFDCRKLVVQRIAKIKDRDCDLHLFEYLVKNKVDYSPNSIGVFPTSYYNLKGVLLA